MTNTPDKLISLHTDTSLCSYHQRHWRPYQPWEQFYEVTLWMRAGGKHLWFVIDCWVLKWTVTLTKEDLWSDEQLAPFSLNVLKAMANFVHEYIWFLMNGNGIQNALHTHNCGPVIFHETVVIYCVRYFNSSRYSILTEKQMPRSILAWSPFQNSNHCIWRGKGATWIW